MQRDDVDEVELRDFLAVIRRQRRVVAATLVTVVAAALTISFVQTPVYEGMVEILLQSNRSEEIFAPDANSFVAPDPARVETEIGVMKSLSVRQAVEAELGRPIEVSIVAQGETDLVRLTAENTEPDEAALWANTYAEIYIATRRQRLVDDLQRAITEVQTQIDQIDQEADQPLVELDAQIAATEDEDEQEDLEEQRDDLQLEVEARQESSETQRSAYATRLNQLQVAANLTQTGGAQIVSQALEPTSPIRPNPLRNGVLAGVLGLVLGVGLAFLREYLDDSLKTKDDLQRASGGLPVIGLIPAVTGWKDKQTPRIVTITEPSSPAAEAYRSLRTAVQFIGLDQPIKAIQVTSPNSSEGKTTTLANLAVALARAGQRVIVASCDLRRPRIHDFFGLPDDVGLTSVLLGEVTLASVLQAVPSEEGATAAKPKVGTISDPGSRLDRGVGLALLPAGPAPPNPSELLASRRIAELLDQLKDECDFLLVDSPPVLPVTDALVLATMVDATILVGTADRTSRKEIHRSVELLSQVDAPLVGTVLNGVNPEATYGYGSGYGYAAAVGAVGNGTGPMAATTPMRAKATKPTRDAMTTKAARSLPGNVGNGARRKHGATSGRLFASMWTSGRSARR